MKIRRYRCAFVFLGVLLLASAHADAATINLGTYQLHNHPDGGANPPPYGMRLDELYDPTGGNDIFTFDFEAPGADMRLDYDGAKIHIYGTALGGHDIGNVHANDQFLGLYDINFLFDVGVGLAAPDDDLIVEPGANDLNTGTITPLDAIHPSTGVPVDLGDVVANGFSFRFGDEDDDNGHRGFAGLSGWGWLSVNGDPNAGNADDFLFTAELIPEPATALLMIFGLGMLATRRR